MKNNFNIYESVDDLVDDKYLRNYLINNIKTNDIIDELKLNLNYKNLIYNELGLKGIPKSNNKRSKDRVEVISDVALIKNIDGDNPISIGIEIKSDKDSTSRLKKQMKLYYSYYDYIYILTTESMLNNINKVILELIKEDNKYKGIGILLYSKRNNSINLKQQAILNNTKEPSYWIRLLWNNELINSLAILNEFNTGINGYHYKKDRANRIIELMKVKKDIYLNDDKIDTIEKLVYSQFYIRAVNKYNNLKSNTRHEWDRRVEYINNLYIIYSEKKTKHNDITVITDIILPKKELLNRLKKNWSDSLRFDIDIEYQLKILDDASSIEKFKTYQNLRDLIFGDQINYIQSVDEILKKSEYNVYYKSLEHKINMCNNLLNEITINLNKNNM